MNQNNHNMDIRIYYEDTDAGGIVYHANYVKYLERGRTEWLRALGFEQDILLEQNIMFVVKHMSLDFQRAARFNQVLSIQTQLVQLKGASLKFKQIIIMKEAHTVLEAEVLVACLAHDTFKPCRLPRKILGEIERVI